MAKAPKVELPASLDAPFEPAADATVDVLQAQIGQMQADATKILDGKEGSHEQRVAAANWYMAAIQAAEGRQNQIVENDAAQSAELDALRTALGGTKAGDPDPTDPTAETGEGEDDKEDDPDGGVDSGGVGAGAGADAGAGAAVLVASASTKRRSVIRGVASLQKLPEITRRSDRGSAYLTAAAEINGFRAGEKVDWTRFGEAAEKTFAKMPSSGSGAGRIQLGIGNVNIPSDERLVASAARGDANLDEAISWALSMERLKAESGYDSLVAAGGWCAPSEVLYDLINMIAEDGMVDVPGITVNRGGVRYSLGPDFTAVYNDGANFTRTETQTIAGLAKPIVNIPCPSFTDNRMVVDGLYLTGDILSSKGYPEAYTDFTQKSLSSFAHYVNAMSIADMVTLSGTLIDLRQAASSPTWYENKSVATELLGAVELAITDMRYKNRLSLTDTVDVIFPVWLKGAIRSDLAKRQATENVWNISDADIAQYFSVRGANVQWVMDWQDAFTGVSGGFGSATAVTSWPTTVQFMVHPSGTFVRALSDVIELNAVYDSTLLTTNQYVALFMEQARLTLKRTWDARLYETKVLVTGASGAPFDYTAAQPNV